MSKWRVIDFSFPDELPRKGSEIYFSMSEGEGRPFTDPGRMKADLDSFRSIQARQPNCIIIWRPCPPPPAPPKHCRIVRALRCTASGAEQRKCIYCDEGYCFKFDETVGGTPSCSKQKARLELSDREVDEE